MQIVPLDNVEPVKAYVDFACRSADGTLLLIGWLFDAENQVEGFSQLRRTTPVEGKSGSRSASHIKHGVKGVQLFRVTRPDVAEAMSASESRQREPYGFVLVIPNAPPDLGVALRLGGSRYAMLAFDALADLAEIGKRFENCTPHSGVAALAALRVAVGTAHPLTMLVAEAATDLLDQEAFLDPYQNLPQMVEQLDLVVAAVDRVYTLGQAGMLVYGWQFKPKDKPCKVTVHGDDGSSVDITDRMFPLLREDVLQGYRHRFPEMDYRCGFVCLVPLPTGPDDARALCFDFGDEDEVWLRLPTEENELSGVALMKQMLAMVPAPESMRNELHSLFGQGLGQAVEAVNVSRPAFAGRVEVRQFGQPVASASVSVVVPLYGRYDFLRHQLAQFVDDADFAGVDLIYVVDDPAILAATLELAASCHALFDLPFRVVWYGQNRGFAGANNIGAGLARGEYLVLLNSDVIPQRPGWLAGLRSALDSLPDAGAVGPLLEFGDGSIQHAGMYPRRDALLPGFLLNTHKGMGAVWHGGEEPSEHPMLTAACVMLRTRDYLDLGGLDEGYIVGDFEDSDLCMALRKQGKRLWLTPGVRLWHLERQSQNLGDNFSLRQLVTLFNGWRYQEKIRTGRLADPTQVELSA